MNRKKIFGLLLSCVRFSVKGEPLPENTAQEITGESAEELYRISNAQDLAHLVSFALEENGLLLPGRDADGKFKKKLLAALYRSEVIEHERSSLCDLLEEAKIPHIPLKGAVIRDYYPETWMRTSADADILIPKNRLEDAISILRNRRN